MSDMDVAATEKRPGHAGPSRPPLRHRLRQAASALVGTRRRKRCKDGRHIPLAIEDGKPLVDARYGRPYICNDIRTGRYSVWDFVPRQLFHQFTRVGNFYFLCVGIPQMVPGLSTTGSYTTILPLLFFILLTLVKEAYDDYRRHRLDWVENANLATVVGRKDRYTGRLKVHLRRRWNPFHTTTTAQLRTVPDDEFGGMRWVPVRWSRVEVGDVVLLRRDEPVPADLVLLYSDGENGLAYVETMDLDGETSLKTKHVSHALQGCGSIEGIAKCRADFVVEHPNPNLFDFNGRVTVNGKTLPLTLSEVVYRGSVLRNTARAVGLVVNTGEECKVRLNSNQHKHAKRPLLEKVINVIVVILGFYVLVLSAGLSLACVRWQRVYEESAWYPSGATIRFHKSFIAFIIMFNNVVPLSLYVSLEIIKLGQLILLNSDLKMYHEETDTPTRCNTNTVLENLGQVGYVFSDKTGTLTENIMKFRKASVAGTVWLHEMDLEQSEADVVAAAAAALSHSELSARKLSAAAKVEPATTGVSLEDGREPVAASVSPSRPPTRKRPLLHWRSSGRPDHVQPQFSTSDLVDYMRLRPHSAFSRKAREYMLAVALCHTCLPETKDGKVEFQASSPDELALVRAAQEMGYCVTRRTSQSITLRVPRADGQSDEDTTFQILDVIEFSSARKRMSVVVRCPDGRISVVCKGADSAILPRLTLSSLARQKANEVRKSADLEREMHRRGEQQEPRNSFGGQPSLTVRRSPGPTGDGSVSRCPTAGRSKSFEMNKPAQSSVDRLAAASASRGVSLDVPRAQRPATPAAHARPGLDDFDLVNDPSVYAEPDVFSKCFKHLDDFATEGLRTLVYAQRFVSEQDYGAWKKVYDEATTSLTNRQAMIEAAGELMEHSFDLVGATAIEDKLQQGVPETVDRLRRANIKIWMLTGDKRETAINIAHSARICRPGSDLYVVDAARGPLEPQLGALAKDLQQARSVHSVVVIDGLTLAVVEKSAELLSSFYASIVRVDSVICCRASPAQKALLVRAVRSRLGVRGRDNGRGLTLAVGDGANDLAMIQASDVGVGISGKEGMQAARVADYAVAQFRFLQRLLLVHGRWNYVRSAKFILCTFWKEMFFYLPAALYQQYNGYSGPSLYHPLGLMVFNTLFTSLCTIYMGICEQDLCAKTLLAVPELYVYGQRNMGLNLCKLAWWMLLAAVEGAVAWYGAWAGYGWLSPARRDDGLYALGTLVFTVGVLWINLKLFILETHYKTALVPVFFCMTTWGWFAWVVFLDGVCPPQVSGLYAVHHTFSRTWGKDASWWLTVVGVLALLGLMELSGRALKRQLLVMGLWHWPPWRRRRLADNVEEWDVMLWQEQEQDAAVRERLRRLAQGDEVVDEDGVPEGGGG